jgi:hypothetical protein
MNEIDHFKVFVLYSDDVTTNVDHVHVKIVHLMNFSYIVIEDKILLGIGNGLENIAKMENKDHKYLKQISLDSSIFVLLSEF